MRFNPLVEEKMLTEYPDLCDVVKENWTFDPFFDKILRYIIMVYDPESPVYKNENEINIRRGIAAELCCLEMEKEELENVFKHQHGIVTVDEETGLPAVDMYMPQIITQYLKRFSRSKEHAAIVATDFVYWESVLKMLEPITGKNSKEELESVQKKKIISDQIPVYLQTIKSYLLDFYGGDEELVEEVKKFKMNPESIGNVLKDKKR